MQRSKRGGIPHRRYEIEGESFMCAYVDIDEPTTYEESVTSQNANDWMTAMKEEMSSMAKNNVWETMDVKEAFLNGELDEEIYMDQPEGFQEMRQKRKVSRLKRSIYGLKQSSK
ncbi:UNVERIFIED_CONTAM: Retrovirus-related Pol polyprotein from transposon TNT 1-94 [Sesamum radiatum]|uniref:Retrovirus-related Pol polyprotein from transposon TNT 1-94 n=1 Tax=Sesamum radiatum TaxID=300843 RepID=A0AAW2V1A0_SESRA